LTLFPFVDSLDLEFGWHPGPMVLAASNELAGCQVAQ